MFTNIKSSLLKCWSSKTSSKWTKENPYKGQCAVTSIVINEFLGGKILKTPVNNQWHYYNLVNGKRFDFTSKQFNYSLNYQDIKSSRDEAFSDTNETQYKELKRLMEKELLGIIDLSDAENYKWGNNCDGWYFVKSENLSVIRETMPPMTNEVLHYHIKAQQFFYILSGIATFEINGIVCNIEQNRGIHIKPGIKHKIANNSNTDLEFIVISQPNSHGDRVIIDDNK